MIKIIMGSDLVLGDYQGLDVNETNQIWTESLKAELQKALPEVEVTYDPSQKCGYQIDMHYDIVKLIIVQWKANWHARVTEYRAKSRSLTC